MLFEPGNFKAKAPTLLEELVVDAMDVATATLSELIDRVDSGTRLGNKIDENLIQVKIYVNWSAFYLEVSGRLEMLENETPCMFSTISSLLLVEK